MAELTATNLPQIFPQGTYTTYTKDHIICDLHRAVKTFRWLISGVMDYYILLEDSAQEIMVCQIAAPLSTIGHVGLHAPGRYTYKTVVSSETATFFEVPIQQVDAYLKNDDNQLLKQITGSLYQQLRVALQKQTELLQPVRFSPLPEDRQFFMATEDQVADSIKIMRCSPFLDQFTDSQLASLANLAERRDYEPFEILYTQDKNTNGLYILIDGEVSIKRIEDSIEIKQRAIANTGFIFGWSSFLNQNDICNAMTTKKTALYFISQQQLQAIFEQDKTFEYHFYHRLLWLITNQMNAAFLRYTGLLGKHNLQAVFQLIHNNASRLPLDSALHQVGHLLKNTNTKKLAYQCLTTLLQEGTALERHIASLSMELLHDDKEELDFILGLQNIYKTVANTTADNPEITRKNCAEATRSLFQNLNVHIEGWENLPESSGHIFMYNHLINHPQYTLNNNFQITLDSHFVSALVLDKKYNEPGIRTVRIGRGQEYGHQNYYNNLGHINVYTKESDKVGKDNKKESRSIFYKEAERHLNEGINLLISPEGTSYKTEESPGPFKLGSFKLASKMKKEPLLVPIVLVNFDYRIKDNLYYCKILPPFKLSERIKDNTNKSLIAFTQNFQKEYSNYVSKARERAEYLKYNAAKDDDLSNPPEMWAKEIIRLQRRVQKLESQDNLTAFYGSSSIRLWVGLKKDLAPLNVINLGFGGSSFAWCIHYFDAVFGGIEQLEKIVLYAGENDLHDGKSSQEVLADCKTLIGMLQSKFPSIKIALISLKPSVEREAMIPQIIETNLLLSKYIIGELNAQFINVFGRMITSDNRPMPELFLSDGLHLNRKGYHIWSSVIKEALFTENEYTLTEQEHLS